MFSKLKQLLQKKTPSSSQKSRDSGISAPASKPGHLRGESPSAESNAQKIKESPKPVNPLKGRTRQGLPVFHPDENFEELFGVDEEGAQSNPPTTTGTTVRQRKTKTHKKAPPRLDKHGFPIMDNRDDLEALFLGKKTKNKETVEDIKSIEEKPEADQAPRTKHGIRILRDDDSPFDKEHKPDDEPQFEDLLYESLGEKTMDVLLNEKKSVDKKRKKLTLKQILSRYPTPQGQLDLHGYTALKAELKVESYLKNAFYNETHTVNIIVGKGLHSEGGAILPDVVEKKLVQMKKEGVVLSYAWDKKRKSQSGAVIVYLKTENIQ